MYAALHRLKTWPRRPVRSEFVGLMCLSLTAVNISITQFETGDYRDYRD